MGNSQDPLPTKDPKFIIEKFFFENYPRANSWEESNSQYELHDLVKFLHAGTGILLEPWELSNILSELEYRNERIDTHTFWLVL